MKFLITLCVLALVTLAAGQPGSRGCIYIEGQCMEECEVGTHSYDTGCGPLTPEPTCEKPNPVPEEGDVCDFSACYCDSPTVRDTISGKCVQLNECPKSYQ